MKENRSSRIVCSDIDFYPKRGTTKIPDSRMLKSSETSAEPKQSTETAQTGTTLAKQK